jgi:hypothetical protein
MASTTKANTILWIGGMITAGVGAACTYLFYLFCQANAGVDTFEPELRACRGRLATTCAPLEGRWLIIHPRLVRGEPPHKESMFLAQTDYETVCYVEIRDNRIVDVAFNEECKMVPELVYDH